MTTPNADYGLPTGLAYIIEVHRLADAEAWGVDVLDARSPSADGTSHSAIGKAAHTDLTTFNPDGSVTINTHGSPLQGPNR